MTDMKAPWEDEHIERLWERGVIRTYQDEVEFRALARGRMPWSPFFRAPKGSMLRAQAELAIAVRRLLRPLAIWLGAVIHSGRS